MAGVCEFRWPVRVYIEDTDAGGIVYYVNYLKFMERARTEWLRSLGFGKQFIFNNDLMFVVKSANTEYFKPAQLDDELEVGVNLLQQGGANLILQQRVYRDDELLCEAGIQIVCVERQTMKPKRIPKPMLAELLDA